MPKKRCLPESCHAESPKKRLRRTSPNEQDKEMSPSLKDARISLRKTEKENIKLRVEKIEKTVTKAILFIGRDLRKHNGKLGQKIIKKYQKNPLRFPVDYGSCMGFIDCYTGVKKRTKAEVCWDEKESKNWLNRQRANVYGPTLFKDALDFIDTMCHEISREDTKYSRHLRRIGICKLLVELLQVNYKPKSKQAAEKRLICANSIKNKIFRDRLIHLVGWQDITKDTTLESIAQKAETEYQSLVASYGALQSSEDDEASDSDESEDEDEEMDTDDEADDEEMEGDGRNALNKKSTRASSRSGSPRKRVLPPLVVPPVGSLDTSTMPSSLVPQLPIIPRPQMSVVPTPTSMAMHPVTGEGTSSVSTALALRHLVKRVSDLEKELSRMKHRVLTETARAEYFCKLVPAQLRENFRPSDSWSDSCVEVESEPKPRSRVPALPLPPFPHSQTSIMGLYGGDLYSANGFGSLDSLSTIASGTSNVVKERSAFGGSSSENWSAGIGP